MSLNKKLITLPDYEANKDYKKAKKDDKKISADDPKNQAFINKELFG